MIAEVKQGKKAKKRMGTPQQQVEVQRLTEKAPEETLLCKWYTSDE